MKKIYMLNNSKGVIGLLLGLKSRITTVNPVLTMLALLMVALFGVNEEAWATWPTFSGTITKSGSTYYVLNASKEESVFQTGSHPYDLAGPGAKLTFDATCTLGAVQNLQVYDGNSVIFDEYVGKYRYVFPVGTMDYVSYGGDGSIVVDAQATQVTFRGAPAATLSRYFKNVKVTMFSGVLQPSITSGTWTYTAANYAADDSYKNFTVDWSNLASLPLSKAVNGSSDDRSQFSYEIFSNTQTLAEGKYGTATIRVKYKHDKVGTHSVKINVGDYSITFTGTTNKITPYIVTTPTVDTITYGQTISNSQLGTGLVKADLINNTGAVVDGTWTIDENGQTVMASGGSNTTVHLTFTPTDGNTYNVIHTTQTMFVRSAATITWASAYSAEKPTIPVGKTIENAASTNANGATVTYSTPNTDIIAIENEGTTFRAIAEGEATITASHGVTATHGSASISKTFKTTYKDIQVIVWTDRFDRLTTEMTSKNLLAQVWIENPSTGVRTYSAARTALLEYSVEDNTVVSIPNNSTTLTIHKKGNTTITASVEGDDQYEEASVTMPVKVREPSEGCDDPIILKKENNGSSDYLYRLFSDDTKKPALYTDEYAINVAQGRVPDKLSFGHKGSEYKVIGLSFWTYYSGTINAQQKVNGQWIDVENSSVTPEKEKWNTKDGLQLDERATHIRFCRPQGGEGYHYVNNVEVTMKHFIRTATPTVDFGNTIKVNSSEYQDVVVKYSNVKDALQVVNPFTSDVTVSDEVIDVDSCGAFGSATLRISFSPTTATEIDDYIVVKDPIVGNSSALSIRVKADVQRADQTITWNPATSISTIDQILLNGTTNGQEYGQMNVIGYEVTNNDGVISVTNNVVTILKPGTVTITASQPGTANYDVAEPVEKNFTISAEPLTLVAPTASDITYGQALPTLIGGSAKDSKGNDVDGTFAWQNPDAVLNAGNNQTPNVVFTPSENAAWYTGLTTTTTINVAKADPVVTVENVSFAYGTKAEEVALDGTGDGEWSWTDSRKGQVLAVDTYEMDVHFAPTDDANYNAIDKKITLTVTKADPAATVENVSFAYGTKAEDVTLVGTGAGEWTWTDSRKGQTLTVGEYEMDVHFAPTDDANYNAIDTKITLTVTKANPVATANAVEITYGATAASVDLEGTGLAGEWTWTDSRKDDVLAAGEYEMDVHFAPIDDANYNEKDATVTLTVNKAPSVATPSAAAITAGQKVSESALTNSGTEGTWVWDNAVKNTTPAAGMYNYTVHFTPENDNYTTLTTTVSLKVNALVNEFTNAAGDGDWSNDSNWSSGSKPEGANPDVIVSGQLIIDEDVTVGNLTIEPEGGVTVVTNGTLTINGSSNDQSGYGDLYVKNGGEVNVVGSLKVGDLVVEASIGTSSGNAESGQVAHAEHVVYTNAYIDINMDPSGEMDDTKWYGFTVPFAVDAHNGVSRKEGSTIRQCVYGSDYLIAEYDAIKRLNSGNGWKFISGNTLNAGQFYFLTVDGSYNTYRFKASGSTYAPADDASLSINGDVTNYNANWNGVGNSTLQHVTASYDGGEYVQVYKNGQDAYQTVRTDEATFVVGCPFFVQAKVATTLSLSEQNSSTEKYYAPRRIQDKATGVARISLSATEGGYSDQIYFSAVDKEQDAYIIGQDLAKAGESTVVPQLWMAQYNQKLSVHEAALNRDRAACSLGIYTPKSGLYEIAVERAPEDATLYLTYNGRAIWNLSMSAYEFDLEKGTTEGYGLRIVASEQTTTDIENGGLLNDENGVRKVLIDNVIYVVTPEGKMYDIVGKGVKY